jgi:hypothetical protein
MKNLLFITRLLLVVFALFTSSFALISCKDDDVDTDGNEVKYENVTINGTQEVPPVTTTATGTFSGTYNKATKVLTYTITHNVTNATMAHFHEAPRDSSGAVVLPIAAATPTAPSIPTSISNTTTLSAAQESDLLRGRLYINIHSTTNPTGEIRGQIPAE